MFRLKKFSSISLSLLFTMSVLVGTTSRADEISFKAPKDGVLSMEQTDVPTEILQRLYPLVPFFAANTFMHVVGPEGGTQKFAGLVVMASTFRAGSELARAAGDLGLVAKGSLAEAASAIALFIPAALLNAMDSPITIETIAAGTNELGQGYRHLLTESAPVVTNMASDVAVIEQEHYIEGLKTAGALLTIETVRRLMGNHRIVNFRFTDKVGAGLLYTSTYLLKDAVMDHFKHVGLNISPALPTAALLSFVGTIATVVTEGAHMNGILAAALLEPGAFVAVSTALDRASAEVSKTYNIRPEIAKYTAYTLSAMLGAYIFPDLAAVSAPRRMQRVASISMMLPLAFSIPELAKTLWSHLSWK